MGNSPFELESLDDLISEFRVLSQNSIGSMVEAGFLEYVYLVLRSFLHSGKKSKTLNKDISSSEGAEKLDRALVLSNSLMSLFNYDQWNALKEAT